MPHRRYRLDIYQRGVTSTTGTITRTFGSSEIGTAPSIGGQTIRISEGLTESVPWTVDVVDRSSAFTELLLNSSGRLQVLGRLVRIRHSLNSTATTAYSNIGVGRLVDVQLGEDVASYRLTISDERWLERRADCFVTAKGTTRDAIRFCTLVMPGPFYRAGGSFADQSFGARRWIVRRIAGNYVWLRLPVGDQGSVRPGPTIAGFVRDDLRPDNRVLGTASTRGNFVHTRFGKLTWTSTGPVVTDYEIATFDGVDPGVAVVPQPASYVDSLDTWGVSDQTVALIAVWPTGQPSPGTYVTGFVYAPTAPPSEVNPLWVGPTPPLDLGKRIYQGKYSASTAALPRISTAAFATLASSVAYGLAWYRITRPWNMAEFLDTYTWPSYMVAPVYDSSGRIAPVSLLIPTTAIAPASLPTITSTNALSHPSWAHPSREVVTVVRAEYPRPSTAERRDPAADQLAPNRESVVGSTYTHDTATVLGRYVVTRKYGQHASYRTVAVYNPQTQAAATRTVLVPLSGDAFRQFASGFAQLLFDRAGDGPAYTMVETSSAIARNPGQFVKLSIPTFAGASTQRGSTRIYQVLAANPTPRGIAYSLVDIGPNQSVAAPGLAVARSSTAGTNSTRHAVKFTASAVAAGARWFLELGRGATTASTAPTAWALGGVRTTATLTATIDQFPANSKIFGRAYAERPARLRSPLSAVASVITATLPGPTTFAVSSITGGGALFKWTNGSTSHETQIMVDATSTATLGSSNVVRTVAARTTRYAMFGLNRNDGHKAGVRHIDPYGGASTSRTATFTTTTAYLSARTPKGISIVSGAV